MKLLLTAICIYVVAVFLWTFSSVLLQTHRIRSQGGTGDSESTCGAGGTCAKNANSGAKN